MAAAGLSTKRRKTRMIALQVLYETSAVAHDPSVILRRVAEEEALSSSSEVFARKLIEGVIANREEIDKIIATLAPSWPIEQMALVDRNILSMAIYEIMLGGETPPKVAINEAVELAKVFGADSSPRFVNGVLGSVMETVKK
ncbi:MAG: transcription antitermination factor NusB [Chloroflexi bacterium]|nr:transcription antitermination factor NusB [Chloroflexota bacterium]